MATQQPLPGQPNTLSNGSLSGPKEVELLRVFIAREGQRVSAQWAVHPQLKLDLEPEEWRELVELMGQVTRLVGQRFAEILSAIESDRPGTA
jgi:hypothetical protein